MLNQTTIFGIISLINFLTCIFIGAFLLVREKVPGTIRGDRQGEQIRSRDGAKK